MTLSYEPHTSSVQWSIATQTPQPRLERKEFSTMDRKCCSHGGRGCKASSVTPHVSHCNILKPNTALSLGRNHPLLQVHASNLLDQLLELLACLSPVWENYNVRATLPVDCTVNFG
jgi:hypothetical protein